MASPIRAVLRLAAYLAFTFALMPVQAVALATSRRLAERIPLFYHRWSCRILGLEVRVIGKRSRARPTLFVSNHGSYIDISVLASVVPASFVAKTEVATWPLFGILARLQRTVFVERRGRRAARQRDEIRDRLRSGDNLVLFAEGTSADGMRVHPFKSALFSVAQLDLDGRKITVQPVSIAYTRLDGMPMGRSLKPFIAWYGDMEMLPHLVGLLGLGKITVDVVFHPPVDLSLFQTRKALSDHCHDVVAEGVALANAGRPATLPA